MRTISTMFQLEEEEYLKLKVLCAKKSVSIREVMKEITLEFIQNNELTVKMNGKDEINITT